MDEDQFIALYFLLIGAATGVITGVTIAGSFLGQASLILSYIMLLVLYGMLVLGWYCQRREERDRD